MAAEVAWERGTAQMNNILILEYTPAELWDRIFCRNSSSQAVCDTPIARITSCVSSLRI